MLNLFFVLMLLTIAAAMMLMRAEEAELLAEANEACGFTSPQSDVGDTAHLMKRNTPRTDRPSVRPPRMGLTVIGQDADKVFAQERAWEQDSGIRRYTLPAADSEAVPDGVESGQGAA